MYNSTNLPLSPRKVVKKTIAAQIRFLSVFIFFGMFGLIFWQILATMPKNNGWGEILGYVPFIILVGFILLEACVVVYEYYYYKLYYYNFTDQQGEIRKGVISRATGIVRYERLQNIFVDQDILDRMFGLYDVHYETAGEKSGFYSHVDGLNKENADKLIAFLNEKANSEHSSQSVSPVASILPTRATETVPMPRASSGEILLSRENCPVDHRVVWCQSGTMGVILGVIVSYPWWMLIGGIAGSFSIGVVMIALVPLVIVFLLSYWYGSVWYKNFRFSFTHDKGEMVSQVIGQSQSYLYYDRIQNVNIKQSIVERMFGICSVIIETAGVGIIGIPGLTQPNAERLKDFLLEKARTYKHRL